MPHPLPPGRSPPSLTLPHSPSLTHPRAPTLAHPPLRGRTDGHDRLRSERLPHAGDVQRRVRHVRLVQREQDREAVLTGR